MELKFKAEIYKVGINACVDVPENITEKMTAKNGYIKVKGVINGFKFSKHLVPVKNKPYRLFINIPMLKGGKSELGKTAEFVIVQDFDDERKSYPIPEMLTEKLNDKKLTADFNNLTESRKTEILKYLNYIKTEKTLGRNIDKLVGKLERKEKNIRIP
ncbi:DUF1905 domain-containing protein [Joostella sp. CR20]|uniref:DUF1905 domain-containing protein n=1 Tax=Joostella sp. CR20 TaxID=2804312 RepID=UPI00313B9284